MKNVYLFLSNALLAFCACFLVAGCEETIEELTYYPIARIATLERDSLKTVLSYDELGLSGMNFYVYDTFVGQAVVQHKPNSMNCTINGVYYEIKFANTHGAMRAETITAYVGGVKNYTVNYHYDTSGRINQADFQKYETGKNTVSYNVYTYEGNAVVISDENGVHRLELSSEENTGNVCNVLDFAGASITSEYIINPDLYYLNIYGAPIRTLPAGQEIGRTQNNELSRVGKYRYSY
ncbi:MAG: hypothetical protein LBT42_06600 [Tannerella sp.]|nr:hypothetical protein [Tannerella sp.]